jgi:hypothetical protein
MVKLNYRLGKALDSYEASSTPGLREPLPFKVESALQLLRSEINKQTEYDRSLGRILNAA